MADQPSVCIVGGGAIGLASAVQLALRGATDIVVLEAQHIAAGSSGLSVGIVETQYVEPLDIELRARAMSFFHLLERDRGLDITRNGYLRLGHTEAAASAFARSVEFQHDLGIADAQLLDAGDVARLVPDMRVDDVTCGLFGPSDGFIDGHLYCSLLAEWAGDLGVQVLGSHRVIGSQVEAGRRLLHTERGSFSCDIVVNAAGPWGASVANTLGYEMPLEPQRHQAVVVHIGRDLGYVMPSVMDYTPHSGETGLYFRHERVGQLIAGVHTEEATEGTVDPERFARSADPDFLEEVARLLSGRLPSLSEAGLAHGWAGVYPVSPDGVPQVGPVDGDPTMITAGGAGGSGIQLSPVIGELVADWVTLGEPRAISYGVALIPTRPTLQVGDRGQPA
jgi:glycine/D-amino acid oxidase-like deaminating enzyme